MTAAIRLSQANRRKGLVILTCRMPQQVLGYYWGTSSSHWRLPKRGHRGSAQGWIQTHRIPKPVQPWGWSTGGNAKAIMTVFSSPPVSPLPIPAERGRGRVYTGKAEASTDTKRTHNIPSSVMFLPVLPTNSRNQIPQGESNKANHPHISQEVLQTERCTFPSVCLPPALKVLLLPPAFNLVSTLITRKLPNYLNFIPNCDKSMA